MAWVADGLGLGPAVREGDGEALDSVGEGDALALSDGDGEALDAEGDAERLADGDDAGGALVEASGTAARTPSGAAWSRVGGS
ncbi:hypothetical protein L1856_17375 [Streptomyces sp. Tue 6430]|nr:hypothetical protein [Streptomyces sp. Tue 6430]